MVIACLPTGMKVQYAQESHLSNLPLYLQNPEQFLNLNIYIHKHVNINIYINKSKNINIEWLNCPKKCHQERIFFERHGKAKKLLLVSGGVRFPWLSLASGVVCESEALRNSKPCSRGQGVGPRGRLPGAEGRGLSTPPTAWIRMHIHALTQTRCVSPMWKGKLDSGQSLKV